MRNKEETIDFIKMLLRDAISEIDCRELEELDSDSLSDAVRYLEDAIYEINDL